MEELDLKDLFNIFWNRKIQILLIIAIFIVIGVIYSIGFVTPKYTSSTTLVLATSENKDQTSNTTNSITTTDVTLNSKLVSTYSELIKSKNVLRQVIENLGINIEEETLRKNITVNSVSDTELIEIKVTNESPEVAAKVANEIAKVFTEKVGEIYNINNVHIVDNAEVASDPSNVNFAKDVLIFAFIGLIIAVVYSLISNMLDTTVQSVEDIEKQFNIPVLVSIQLATEETVKGGRKK